MASKTPEQIDAEIARLQEQREEAERKRRDKVQRAIQRAAERSGLLTQSWTARDLESAFRTLARHGTAAIQPPAGSDAAETPAAAPGQDTAEADDESAAEAEAGGDEAAPRRGFGAFGAGA